MQINLIKYKYYLYIFTSKTTVHIMPKADHVLGPVQREDDSRGLTEEDSGDALYCGDM